jgi:pimeloyl-ACP methyl ester carboxylesterase
MTWMALQLMSRSNLELTDMPKPKPNKHIFTMRNKKRMTIVILSLPVIFLLLMVTGLWLCSPGKPQPFLNPDGRPVPGSISEKTWVEINGNRQGMFIQGIDSTKPVLLFVHGGPGMPEFAISRQYPMVLENHFTVCWWEMRGAGLSFSSNLPLESMTFDQLVSDILEVTKYLQKRFGQEKIYLMAHSGGTFTAIQAAAREPQLYHAYLAMSQISNQQESEQRAYAYMVEQFTRLNDQKMLRKFDRFPPTAINTPDYYVMRDAPMHQLGVGTTHKMRSVISGVFMPVMLNRAYTLPEKINIWKGKAFNTKTAGLWNQLVLQDLTQMVTKLDIPVFFFSGRYDYTVSRDLAKAYFDRLEAPVKCFYTFERSAHSPLFEEPEKMKLILQGAVLNFIF